MESGPELSDSGSSGHWSVDVANGSSAPSSPATAEPESETLVPPDEGLDMELDQVLFDEPAPRKRRVRRAERSTDKEGRKWGGANVKSTPAELREGGVPMSVAELREGADLRGWNQTSHQNDSSVVRLLWLRPLNLSFSAEALH